MKHYSLTVPRADQLVQPVWINTNGYGLIYGTRFNPIRYEVGGWWLGLSNHRSKSWSQSVSKRSDFRFYFLYEVCTWYDGCVERHPALLANMALVHSIEYRHPLLRSSLRKGVRVKAYIFCRRARAIWRLTSRFLMSARLSYFFLPFTSTSFIFTRRLVVYIFSGSIVKPPSSNRPRK